MEQKNLKAAERAAPRMRLCLPGTLLAVSGNYDCILTNLSRTGVLIALREPLKVGAEGYLRCGPIDHFMVVTRKEKGVNALSFDIPVDDKFVFGVRQYAQGQELREHEEMVEAVLAWTSGRDSKAR
jgi:hypothetical protein